MSRLIAVCGGPYSGKTTFSLKLAQEIYRLKKGAPVIFLSPDLETPSLGLIFPDSRDRDMHSLGKALDRTDIYREDVMKQFVNVKQMPNLAYLGFRLGENRYSYPQPTEDKVCQLFRALKESADYVIADCTCREDDLISRLAKRDCDLAFLLFNPDLKSPVYYASCSDRFVSVGDRKIKILNITEKDLYLPVKETDAYFGGADITVPYSLPLRQQMITGTLSALLRDRAYVNAMEKAAITAAEGKDAERD